MSNHADFAVAASVREAYLNQTIRNLYSKPFFFPLPKTIDLEGAKVDFGGIAQIAAPVIELHPNPQNTARFHFAFFCTFHAQVRSDSIFVNGQSTLRTLRTRVRLDASVDLAVYFGPVNDQIILQLKTPLVTFQRLKLTVLSGTPPPRIIKDALESPQLAAAATNAVRLIPPIKLLDIGSSSFNISQPGRFKESNFSVYEWFSFSLTVNRIVIKIFEGAITAAFDFSRITNGRESALTDLTAPSNGGSIYIHRITEYTDPGDPPFLTGATYGGGADLAFSFNITVMSRMIEIVSHQIAGTPISKDAVLNWVSGGYDYFEKDLQGRQSGLGIDLGLTVRDAIDATVRIRLQPYFRQYDRSTFVQPEGWLMLVAKVEVDMSLFGDIVMGVAHILDLAFSMIAFVPLSLYNYRLANNFFSGINDQFAKADPDNIASKQKLLLQNEAYDAGLPQRARYISVTQNAIDIGYGTGLFPPFSLPKDPGYGAYILPDKPWSVQNRAPIVTSLKLSSEWMRLIGNNLTCVWEIRRKDTNAVIFTGTRRYGSLLGNGISIPHHSKELYLVKEYIVRCRLLMTLANQTGEIWAGVQNIVIEDKLDRSHPYVEWGAEFVYFANAGTDNKVWRRLSRSRIHRTAVAARCKMLKMAVDLRLPSLEREAKTGIYTGKRPRFRYKDELPFLREHMQEHRKELCEYCFFGGPDKKEALPVEDWFEPDQPLVNAFVGPKIIR